MRISPNSVIVLSVKPIAHSPVSAPSTTMPMNPAVMMATRQPISSRLTRATASRPVSRLPVSEESWRSTPVAKSAVIDGGVAVGERVVGELTVDEVGELQHVEVGGVGADQADRNRLLVAAGFERHPGEPGDSGLVAGLGDQVADFGDLDLGGLLQCRGEPAGLPLEVDGRGVGSVRRPTRVRRTG